MPRRSSRLASKYPTEVPAVPAEPVEPVQANPAPEIPVEPPPTPTPPPTPLLPSPQPPTVQQQINNEVAARIHMFNRNIDALTAKITDLTVALDELKKKKDSKRKVCSLM
jgi:hypothetical protein